MKSLQIIQKIINGIKYYSFELRKVDYTLTVSSNGECELWSSRQALIARPCRDWKIRLFDSLQDIENKIKSLRGISQMID